MPSSHEGDATQHDFRERLIETERASPDGSASVEQLAP